MHIKTNDNFMLNVTVMFCLYSDKYVWYFNDESRSSDLLPPTFQSSGRHLRSFQLHCPVYGTGNFYPASPKWPSIIYSACESRRQQGKCIFHRNDGQRSVELSTGLRGGVTGIAKSKFEGPRPLHGCDNQQKSCDFTETRWKLRQRPICQPRRGRVHSRDVDRPLVSLHRLEKRLVPRQQFE